MFLLLLLAGVLLPTSSLHALPEQKLIASDRDTGDNFGYAVDIDGSYAVVGAKREGASDQGAAYILHKNVSGTWVEQEQLFAPVRGSSDYFGHAVAISGNLVAVGAYGYNGATYSDEGRVYIYSRSGTSWSLEAEITGSSLRAGDWFGYSLDLAGNTLVVGAYRDDIGGGNAGAAYVFERTYNKLTQQAFWTEAAMLKADFPDSGDAFGKAVAISPDAQRILIGSPYDDDVTTDAGAAYVFRDIGTGWSQEDKLTKSSSSSGDQFGFAVDLSNNHALIGTPYVNNGQGAAYTCAYQALIGWQSCSTLTMTAPQAPDDGLGYAVSLEGGMAMVGAYSHNSPATDIGTAFLWQQQGLFWTYLQQVNASDYAAGDYYGFSVTLSGIDVAVGAVLDDISSLTEAGSVYIYDLDEDDDGLVGLYDNCPIVANADQLDTDGDGQGDACDPNDDNDAWSDIVDNCDTVPNDDQANLDGDLLGDACDPDIDGDGIDNGVDNCPLVSNFSQKNFDNDAEGDACDADDDNDGRDDVVDDFPLDPTEWLDTDGDGTGNNADTDDDADGLPDTVESLIGTNSVLADSDADGVVDGLEDADGDEYANITEYENGSDLTDPGQTPQVGNYRYERMVPLLSQPWYFDAVAGIATNPFNGDVYLSDQGTGTILRFNRGGKLISRWGETGDQPGEFGTILGLALGPDDVLYVADRLDTVYRVQKFGIEGDYLGEVSPDGGAPFQFSDSFTTTPVAVNALGELYVANSGAQLVQVFDAGGRMLGEWGGPGTQPGEFTGLAGVAVAPDGRVYTAETSFPSAIVGRIQYFTSDGSYLGHWSKYDSGIPADMNPLALAVSADKVFVNSGGFRVDVFSRDGSFLETWDDLDGDQVAGSEGDYLLAMGLGHKGELFVTQLAYHGLLRLSANGDWLGRWGSDGHAPGMFRRPHKIQRDTAGRLYVLDNRNAPRLQKFDADLGYLGQWSGVDDFALDSRNYLYAVSGDTIRVYDSAGALQRTLAPFDDIIYLGFDATDRLFVLEHGTPRVTVYDSAWNYQASWVLSGHSSFSATSSTVVDSSGRIHIQDGTVIKRYQADGTLLGDWGGSGTGPGEFVSTIDRMLTVRDVLWGDVLYVTERDTDRVHRFRNGAFLDSWHSLALPGIGDTTGLPESQRPYLAAVDGQKRVYISGRNNRVRQFTEDGLLLAEIGEAGIGPGQLGSLPTYESNIRTAVAVEGSGRVTLADVAHNRVQAFIDVPLANNPRAIVLAGGGPYPGNALWAATQAMANTAYTTLLYKGFTPDMIQYLSDDTDLKLTGREMPDVDAVPTKANLYDAITSWAAGADSLVIYMTDHGGVDNVAATGTFRMSAAESAPLTAAELGGWLDGLGIPVTVINDSCQSGSFLSIAAPDRTVIGSAAQGEVAYFTGNGALSFSSAFWGRVLNGGSVREAQEFAELALGFTPTSQTPQLDADGDGNANESADYSAVTTAYIGVAASGSGSAPAIGGVSVLTPQPLNGTASATIRATGVTDPDGLNGVWAVLRPPNFIVASDDRPVTDLPRFDLVETAPGTYEGSYDGFTQQGTYEVVVYAEDQLGNAAQPQRVLLAVGTPLSRKAVIVLGGEEADTGWADRKAAADTLYTALLAQGYGADDIEFQSGGNTATGGVDRKATLSDLGFYITSWAGADTQDLLVYLVGESDGIGFRLNPDEPGSESLAAAQLDVWLNTLQGGLPGKLTLVMDADNAGLYLARLQLTAAAGGVDLYRLASALGGAARFAGGISYTKFLAGNIANGATLGAAHELANRALEAASNGQQLAWLDTDSDGIGDKQDLERIAYFSLGPGILLAGDEPVIGSAGIVEDDLHGDPMQLTLWAQDVTTTGTLASVRALVTPPDTDGPGGTEPVADEVALVFNGTRYEAPYSLAAAPGGTYSVSFFAQDTEGAISLPLLATATRQDAYEVDDTHDLASTIEVDGPVHYHSFHTHSDEDWAVFYHDEAQDPATQYTIKADTLGSETDIVLTLADANGSTLSGPRDDTTAGDYPFGSEVITYSPTQTGLYKIRVSMATAGEALTDYVLSISKSGGGTGSHTSIEGVVTDGNGVPLPLVSVFASGPATDWFITGSDGRYSLKSLPAGTYNLTITDNSGNGYQPTDVGPPHPVSLASADATAIVNISMAAPSVDADGDGLADGSDPYPNDFDGDGDGLVDGWDGQVALLDYSSGVDGNNDGYVDGELDYGTQATNPDSDGDGYDDGMEVRYGSLPMLDTDTPESNHINNGDINGDGVVNVIDVLLATRMALGQYQPVNDAEWIRADVVPDPLYPGQVNAGDMVRIQQMALGM